MEPKDWPNKIRVTITGPPKTGKTSIGTLLIKLLTEHGIVARVRRDSEFRVCLTDPAIDLDKTISQMKEKGTLVDIVEDHDYENWKKI